MKEIAGGLIEMNAHMIMPKSAITLMIIGGTLTFIAVVACAGFIVDKNLRCALGAVAVILIGCLIFYRGMITPRVKEIHACASGVVSLELIAARYQIVDVDGKELILREK